MTHVLLMLFLIPAQFLLLSAADSGDISVFLVASTEKMVAALAPSVVPVDVPTNDSLSISLTDIADPYDPEFRRIFLYELYIDAFSGAPIAVSDFNASDYHGWKCHPQSFTRLMVALVLMDRAFYVYSLNQLLSGLKASDHEHREIITCIHARTKIFLETMVRNQERYGLSDAVVEIINTTRTSGRRDGLGLCSYYKKPMVDRLEEFRTNYLDDVWPRPKTPHAAGSAGMALRSSHYGAPVGSGRAPCSS